MKNQLLIFLLFAFTIFMFPYISHAQEKPIETFTILHDSIKKAEFRNQINSYGFSNQRSLRKLQEKNISSYDQLRANLLNDDLMGQFNRGDKEKLRQIALFTLLSDNVDWNKKLIRENVKSFSELRSKLEDGSFERWARSEMDSLEIKQYENKVRALEFLAKREIFNEIVRARNDANYMPNIPEELYQAYSGRDQPCLECNEDNNIFSPAVYLLYLLDFTEESFAGTFDSYDEIQDRFYQDFNVVLTNQDISSTTSYVKLANNVLENYISSEESSEWINTAHFTILNENVEDKSELYGKLGNKKLLIELFDNYTRELGFSRREVQRVLKGSIPYINDFAGKHNLDALTLGFFNIEDNEITYESIDSLRSILRNAIYTTVTQVVKQEQIAEIEESIQLTFPKQFREARNEKFEELLDQSLSEVPNYKNLSVGEYEKLLDSLSRDIWTCLELGLNCYNIGINEPHYFLYEFFLQNHLLYPDSNFAVTSQDVIQLIDKIEREKKYSSLLLRGDLRRLNEIKKTLQENQTSDISEILKTFWKDNIWNKLKKDEFWSYYKANTLFNNLRIKIRDKRKEYLINELGFITDANGNLLDSIALKQLAVYEEERLRSEDEFDVQVNRLAKFKYKITQEESLVVQERFEQQYNLATSKAELGFQTRLRQALLNYIFRHHYDCTGTEANFIQKLGDYLFVDLTITEDNKTTPLSFTINRVHTLFQKAQLGNAYSDVCQADKILLEKAFNKDVWSWMKSYGTWHAAMIITTYPENFLFPELMPKSPFLKALYDSLQNGIQYEDAFSEYEKKLEALSTVGNIHITKLDGPFGNQLYVFKSDSKGLFYTFWNEDGEWDWWREITSIKPMFDHYDKKVKFFDYIFPEKHKNNDGTETHAFRFFFWNKELSNSTDRLYHVSLPVSERIINTDQIKEWKEIQDIEYEEDKDLLINLGPEYYSRGISISIDENLSIDSNIIFAYVTARDVAEDKYGRKFAWKIQMLPEGEIEILNDVSSPSLKEYTIGNITNAAIIAREKGVAFFWNNHEKVAEDFYGITTIWKNVYSNKYYVLGGNMDSFLPYSWLTKGQGWSTLTSTPLGSANDYISPLEINESFDIPPDIGWKSQNGLAGGKYYLSVGNLLYELRLYQGQIKSLRLLENQLPVTHIGDVWYGNTNVGYYGNIFFQNKRGEIFYLLKDNLNQFIKLNLPKVCKNCWNTIPAPTDIESYSPTVMKYLVEYFIHAPILVATHLNENGLFAKATTVLSRVYTPSLEEYSVPSFLIKEGTESFLSKDLEDPFTPYFLADIDKHKYLQKAKLLYVEIILNWADQLFLHDNSESVNRARELYELAEEILNSTGFELNNCGIGEVELSIEEEDNSQPEEEDSSESNPPPSFSDLEDIYNRIINGCPRQYHGAAKLIYDERFTQSTGLVKIKLNRLLTKCQTEGNGNYFGDFIDIVKNEKSALVQGPVGKRIDEILTGTPEISFNELDTKTSFRFLKRINPLPFCIPQNSKLILFHWRIESNLKKIRGNRNFAGYTRSLQPYASPVDPEKLLKLKANSGGIDFDQFIPNSPPPLYRYSYLLERAKYLTSVAQQFQSSMLSSIEKEEREKYSYLQAKQDLNLKKLNVNLQNLRVEESINTLELAKKQKEKTTEQKAYYQILVDQGLSFNEKAGLRIQEAAVTHLHIGAAIKQAATFGVGGIADVGGALSATSSLYLTHASFERRAQEWEHQNDMADYDLQLANIGVNLAYDRQNIVNQEKVISELQYSFANDNLEYLANKFTNEDLYKWMQKELHELYRQQLKMAISTAQAAQRALEFERQTSLDFINYDYWENEKRGLLATERLLQDIEKIEQFRLSTDVRKKEIEKTISLASAAPEAFQQFLRTGVMDFETAKSWFDRDFPGHHMRLIKDVNVSIIALIPPTEGIKATLSNNGISRVMVGAPFEEPSIIYRLPESIALSKAIGANGLFELSPNDPKLLPFEGTGVATTWRLEMPKGANRFNYNTIADVLFTIRYTAMEDRSYRDKVLEEMGQDEEGYVKTSSIRYFSVRNDFPDQWYYFNNPAYGVEDSLKVDPIATRDIGDNYLVDYSMLIDLTKDDFLPNEERRKIRRVSLVVQLEDDLVLDDPGKMQIKLKLYPEHNATGLLDNFNINDLFASSTNFNGKTPYGNWALKLDGFPMSLWNSGGEPDVSKIRDIILVIEYDAKVHYP